MLLWFSKRLREWHAYVHTYKYMHTYINTYIHTYIQRHVHVYNVYKIDWSVDFSTFRLLSYNRFYRRKSGRYFVITIEWIELRSLRRDREWYIVMRIHRFNVYMIMYTGTYIQMFICGWVSEWTRECVREKERACVCARVCLCVSRVDHRRK